MVRAERWRNACRHLLADNRPPGGLEAALHARIDLLPHQLEPALAILRGLGSRLLLADEVGLGKTIQAGLVCAELLVRGAIDRVLVLTPAGLRGQWRDELLKRFSIHATTVDAPALRTAAATLPVGLNPWTTQPDRDRVNRLRQAPGSAAGGRGVLVGPGHRGRSARRRRRLRSTRRRQHARRPSGLCAPADGDAALRRPPCLRVALRTRIARRGSSSGLQAQPDGVQIGVPRRVHITAARPSADERRMHRSLADYTAAVRADRRELHDAFWLALSVLHKRALSSAWSLAQSIDRRLASLLAVGASGAGAQLMLPLGDPDGERSTDDEAPAWPADLGLADADHERRLLTELAAHARTAAAHETKLAMLRRLLRRARESAVVFTEYRDTLLHISRVLDLPCVVLHGGLTPRERAAALAAFASAPRTVLLATDAAGEGLNLHQRLPAGRQRRASMESDAPRAAHRPGGSHRTAAHGSRLSSRSRPARASRAFCDASPQRIAAAQADIGAPDPVGIDEELAIARLVIGGGVR